MPYRALPELVAHADWSVHPAKRWVARARLGAGGRYRLAVPEPVGDLAAFRADLAAPGPGQAPRFLGFDFPLGLPLAYAERAGIESFVSFLEGLGREPWRDVFSVAARAEEITLTRPFYPRRPGPKGSVSRQDLVAGLGLESFHQLLRACDRATTDRPAAGALFWTLGGQQVGKAAIAGWRDLLLPVLGAPARPRLWPFEGALSALLRPGASVIAETYPAEIYRHLGIGFASAPRGGKAGKRVQADRAAQASTLIAIAEELAVDLVPALRAALEEGFGPAPGGEDPFDATVGVLGMINVVRGKRPAHDPSDARPRRIEGWILGQAP